MDIIRGLIKNWVSSKKGTYQLTATKANAGDIAYGGGLYFAEESKKNSKSECEGSMFEDPNCWDDAAATLLNQSQVIADFFPGSQSPEELSEQFPVYVEEININPFFNLQKTDSQKMNYESENYDVFIDAVGTVITDMMNTMIGASQGVVDVGAIKDSITNMAKSLVNTESSSSENSTFTQNSITKISSATAKPEIYYYLTYTYLKLTYESDGKSEVTTQEFVIQVTEFKLNTTLMVEYADELDKLVEEDIGGWIENNTSPTGQKELCYTKKK